MCVSVHVRMKACTAVRLPSLYSMCTKSMATRHCGLPVLDSKSFFLSFDYKKTATTEATSSLLDLVLSLRDSDKYIYFYISV